MRKNDALVPGSRNQSDSLTSHLRMAFSLRITWGKSLSWFLGIHSAPSAQGQVADYISEGSPAAWDRDTGKSPGKNMNIKKSISILSPSSITTLEASWLQRDIIAGLKETHSQEFFHMAL